MPSITTIFRAIVMIAVGAAAVKVWKLYGPTAEQVKTTVVGAVEIAESSWKGQQAAGGDAASVADKRGTAPAFAKATQPATVDPARPATATLTQSDPGVPVDVLPKASAPESPSLITPPAQQTAVEPKSTDDRVPVLLSRLEKLGAAEPKLAPWGDSGHLYRFCCRAALADSPSLTRHFESVAEEPAMAVEQVVAKVEAWRTSQRADSMLRY